MWLGSLIVVDWTDDGLVPTDTDGDGVLDSGCGDHVDLIISGYQRADPPCADEIWDFGMADPTGAWNGEDCFNSGVCHPVGVLQTVGIDQVSSCNPTDLEPGLTTAMSADRDPFLTYYLYDPYYDWCLVFGDDRAYYASLGCTELR